MQRAYRNKPVDNAGFTYDGNRLTAVNDWSRHTMGLNSSRYTYDASGRLKTDSYKGITVDYNYMDLPVTVTKGSEKLEYTYLADGTRVKRKSGSNERHYIHGFEYEGNTLRFVSIPEGRIRRKDNGTWVYDYFLRDHLGNTRVVLTTEQSGTQTYRATMEESTAGQEREHFENVDASRTGRPYNYPDLNPANARVAKVPGRGEGPKLTLKVTAGDTVSISAQAFYNIDRTLPGQGADVVPVVGSAIAALAGGAMVPAGEAAALALDLGVTAGTSVALSSVPNRQDQDGSPAPRAGIRYVLYDNDFEVVETSTGILPVEDRINRVQHLSADRMVLPASGYLEVYAGNDDQTPVYFDNLTVSHTPGRILEESHYYPYGLLIPGISTTALAVNERNAYKFGGKEMQTDLDLNWGDFGARMQDPAVGRWWVPDPLAELYYGYSPYTYCYNNPINFIDPTGMWGLSSSFVGPSGEIVETRDDGDPLIYLVHDPENWNGTKDNLTVIGQTPEPNSLEPYVGENIRSEKIISYLYSEAERLDKQLVMSWNGIANLESLAQIKKNNDNKILLLKEKYEIEAKQVEVLNELMKNKELMINEHNRKMTIKSLQWLYFLGKLWLGAFQAINLPSELMDILLPESMLEAVEVEYNRKELIINNKYKKR